MSWRQIFWSTGLLLAVSAATGSAEESKNLFREPGFAQPWLVGTDDVCAWRHFATENLDRVGGYSLGVAGGAIAITLPDAAKGECVVNQRIALDAGQVYLLAFKVAAEKPGKVSVVYTQDDQPWKNAGLSRNFDVEGGKPVTLHAWFKVTENAGVRSLRVAFKAGLGKLRFSEPRLYAVTADTKASLEKLYAPTASEKDLTGTEAGPRPAQGSSAVSGAGEKRRPEGNLIKPPIGGPSWRIIAGPALTGHGDYAAEPAGARIRFHIPSIQGQTDCGIWYDTNVAAGEEYLVSVNVLCDTSGQLGVHYTQDAQPWRGIWGKTFNLVPGVNRIRGSFTDTVGIKPDDGVHSLRFNLRGVTGNVQLSDPMLTPVGESRERLEAALNRQEIPDAEFVLLREGAGGGAADPHVRQQLSDAEELFAGEQAAWRREREATSAFKTEPKPAADAPVKPAAPVYEQLLAGKLSADHEAMALMRLGQVYLLKGRNADAAAAFAKLPSIAIEPEKMRAVRRELLATALGGQSEVVPLAIFEGIVADPAARPWERRNACIQLGYALLREGKATEAADAFDTALKMPGLGVQDRAELGLGIGHALRAGGDHASARAAYRRVAEDANASVPQRVFAVWGIADTHARENDVSSAVAVLEKVAALLPEPPTLLMSRHLAEETRLMLEELTGAGPGYPDFRTPIPPLPKPAVEFHVAPDGDDANPGTREKPFAGLTRARDAVRATRKDGALPVGGAAVIVRGGEYAVTETFELTAQDGGTAEAPVVYRTDGNETPTLYGGRRLKGLTPVTDAAVLARLPEEGRAKVLQVDLKANGVKDFGPLEPFGIGYGQRIHTEIFWNGEPLIWARWPNDGYVTTVAKVAPRAYKSTEGPAVFEFDTECAARAARWSQAQDIMLWGFWDWTYWASAMGPATLDLAQTRFSGPVPSGGFMDHNVGQKTRFYVFNLLEEIDRPGECYLDRATGMLYLFPPSDHTRATVEISLLNEPFVTMQDVSHLVLQGLQFDCGRHGGIAIKGGANNLVAGCTVSRVAWNGITASGGTNHGVFGCDVNRIGASPVSMTGGDVLTLEPGGHFIENCHIRQFGRIERGGMKVSISGVGNRCVHNRIHGAPAQAVGGGGNDQLVAFNEVYDACREMDDMGVIDFGFDTPADRGHRVMYNLVRDSGGGGHGVGTFGIRLDDCQSGVLIRGNVLYRCAEGMGAVNIHGGKDNIVDNNLFVACGVAFGQCPWGQAFWETRLKRESIVKQLADRKIDQPPYSTRYPELATLRTNADRNSIWRNVIVGCGMPFSLRETDANEIVGTLVLADESGAFKTPGSDARFELAPAMFARGSFRRIPIERVGLYEHELRAIWPVTTAVPKVD